MTMSLRGSRKADEAISNAYNCETIILKGGVKWRKMLLERSRISLHAR